MPPVLGKLIVIGVLACVVALAVRSVWKSHRSKSCDGDCCKCRGCH